ncbi:MAG: hypothetical protein MUC52_03040 [Candidatus Omnitrophica bacterium]|jgi:hypothetical protein|nr:hypothetical protein [Candidatus Omnitrophota bacterium]
MAKIVISAIILAVIMTGSIRTVLSQEGQQAQPDPAVSALINRIDSVEQTQKQIIQRLDKVLANQERIFAELDIIKIRATKR